MDDFDVDSLIPTADENRSIDSLLKMSDLNEVTLRSALMKQQWRPSVTHSLSLLKNILKRRIDSIRTPVYFVVRILIMVLFKFRVERRTNWMLLNTLQLRNFECHVLGVLRRSGFRLSLLQRAQSPAPSSRRYIDTQFITPTSNICERFFSLESTAFGERRRRFSLQNFETQMFLYCNMLLWNMFDVNRIV